MRLLRESDRILNSAEAQALPPHGFRWLHGILQVWNGHNNGAINFTRRNHGAKYGLKSAEPFEVGRKMVLDSGLVRVTREGKTGRPHCYGITLIPFEANPHGDLGLPYRPSQEEKSWSPVETKGDEKYPPTETKLVSRIDQDFPVHIRNARASEYRNKKNNSQPTALTNSQRDDSANESRLQGEDTGSPHQSNSTTPWRPSQA